MNPRHLEDPDETHWTVNGWANSVFPHRTRDSVIKKLFEEIGEFVKTPDEGEWADIIVLLWDLAVMYGIDPQKAINDKMRINRARKWAVNEATGVMQHVE